MDEEIALRVEACHSKYIALVFFLRQATPQCLLDAPFTWIFGFIAVYAVVDVLLSQYDLVLAKRWQSEKYNFSMRYFHIARCPV